LLSFVAIAFSCNENDKVKTKGNEEEIRLRLSTLLNAIENKNLDSLESTLFPSGEMELILPDAKVSHSVKGFVDLHRTWFQDSTWAMETKILRVIAGESIAAATTEAIYREPNRNGKPYFNHMIVSYVLAKEADNSWYVIKDHACSTEKSTE